MERETNHAIMIENFHSPGPSMQILEYHARVSFYILSGSSLAISLPPDAT
jgi:hypothetical protein